MVSSIDINEGENTVLYTAIAIISIFIFFIVDIGNLDAIRQGSEGFYLQISREMFENNSFLTPLYNGKPNFSNPPFHYWIPMPLYYMAGKASLWIARFSMFLVSITGLVIISRWISRYFKTPFYLNIAFLASSLGIFRYSRIFMMEITLTMFSVIACLKLFDYLLTRSKLDFWLSIIFMTVATLIKGPIALIMCFLGCGSFVLFQKVFHEHEFVKQTAYWAIISTLLSSIWFFISYPSNGINFNSTFFIGQGIDIFASESHSIRSVFQGLLIYGLPWSLFLPGSMYFLLNKIPVMLNVKNDKESTAILFAIFNFIFFFGLWLIPSQRSHHYAMPSLPFLLIIIFSTYFTQLKTINLSQFFSKIHNLTFRILAFIPLLIISGLCIALSMPKYYTNLFIVSKIILIIMMLLASSIILFRSKTQIFAKSIAILSAIGTIWVFLLPTFYLPLVPSDIVQFSQNKNIAVNMKKTYFITEAIGKNLKVLKKEDEIKSFLGQDTRETKYLIIGKKEFGDMKLENTLNVIKKWEIWKKNIDLSDIINVLKNKDISHIRDVVFMAQAK